ncbi:serine/threonine-protein phosphatase 6 regulatory ankyrin repeat subunit B-like [Haliotis cracherodii]|uniref:serine/threonine-protein phosphatase 6 regulatory ankyrin repeat subunit B-like n=1 Tax=Haliotis cracherodii TaxID=6455 RepID=UPI0039EB270C
MDWFAYPTGSHTTLLSATLLLQARIYTCESAKTMQIHYLALLIFIVEAYGEDSCGWGKYGDKCDKDCPLNCISHPVRNLKHCHKKTGKCSEGCVLGWFEDLCDHACTRNCLRNTCNRQNGICSFGCDGDYTGDFCNIIPGTSRTPPREYSTRTSAAPPREHSTHTSPTETTPDLAAILVPVFLILVVVLAVVVFILRKRKSGKNRRIPDALAAIIPRLRRTNTASSADEEEPFFTERGGEAFATSKRDDDSICSFVDDVNLLSDDHEEVIRDIKKAYVETETFKKVKEKLETFGHVTISGAPGSGKTSMALMLGAEYRKQGYELVLVEDVDKVQLSDFLDKGTDMCVIFDDMFKAVGSYTNPFSLKHLLYDFQVLLEQCGGRSERRYECLQQEPSEDQRKVNQRNMLLVFTAETDNLEWAMSKLEGQRVFQSSSHVRLGFTREEKEALWRKYRYLYKCRAEVDVNQVMSYKETTVGFPLICKLYARYSGFHTHHELFFEDPVVCIRHQLLTIMSLLDEKSAALILLLLCEGHLDISQLETECGPKLEAHFKEVACIAKASARKDVVKSIKSFCGTFLTEGKITRFSHSVIHDICASVLFNIAPEFTLKHCSIKFLLDHVQVQQANSGTLVARMAASIVSGTFSTYIWHPIWKRKEIADILSQMVTDRAALSDDAKDNILHYACFTGNKYILERLLPHCDINRPGLNGWTSVMYADVSGQLDCLDILVENKADITLSDINNYNLLHLACQHGHRLTVKRVNGEVKTLHVDLVNARGLNYWTPIMCAAISGKKVALDYLIKDKKKFEIMKRHKLDLTLRDSNNDTVLHLACRFGTMSTVDGLLPHTDINSRGNNGQTPVMSAVLSGKKATFDLLVSNKADTTLTDDDNNSVLHLACHVDDVSLIEQIVPMFDINSRGKHDLTPVMKAAVNGKKDAFNILNTLKADLTLTDDNDNNILHLACHGGNVSIVQLLLPKFDINSRGNNGWTPVMCAAVSGVESVFHRLVSQGADLTLRDDYTNHVFHLACIGGNISIVKHLLSGTDINCLGNHGRTAIMIAALLSKPALFKLLLTKKADITLTDDYKDTVLHLACQGGNRSIVKYLMLKFDSNAPGRHGWTTLMNAAWAGKIEVFNLLFAEKDDVPLSKDNLDNVLHLACHGGNTAIMECLLSMCDINSKGNKGRTPVMVAAWTGQKDVFDLLVRKKADLTLTDDYTDNALHLACQGGNTAIVESLLKTVDINTKGQNGLTPVMYAARSGQRHVFTLLVSQKYMLKWLDDSGNNLLHFGCQGGNQFIIKYLLTKFDIKNSRKDGWTTIMMAAVSGKKDAYDLIATRGGNPSLTAPDNDTVLHAACQGGNVAIVKAVIGKFDINTRGRNDQTPLMRAVCGGHVAVYKFLVSHKADQSLVDKGGHTLLHLASQHGQLHMVKYIIDSVDVNTKDKAGLTPVMTSAVYNKVTVFEYLRRRGADLSLVDNVGKDVLGLARGAGSRQIIEHLEHLEPASTAKP